MPDQGVYEKFVFRNIRPYETDQATAIESMTAPKGECCTERELSQRIAKAGDLFVAVVEKQT